MLYNVLFLKKFNNYFNRIIKGFNEVSDYEAASEDSYYYEKQINFSFNDNVSTELVINNCPFDPDYMLLLDNDDTIMSRWFVMEAIYTREGQKKFTLRRDVIYDCHEKLLSSPIYVHKAWLQNDDPFIFNDEGMSFNQIKTQEKLLKDATQSAWIVGYIARNTKSTSIELQLNSDTGIKYKTLAQIAAAIGTTEAKLTAILNIGSQNTYPAFFTNTFKLKYKMKPTQYDIEGQEFINYLTPDLSAQIQLGTTPFFGIADELYYQHDFTIGQAFYYKIPAAIIANKTAILADMDNILSRSYFTQEQLNRLKEYAQEETLILYNGVYYKFRIDASAVLTNQTGNVAWGTTGAIGTTIYNASLQPDVGVLTLRPTGKINIITEDTEVYVHLIESDLGLGIKKLKTTISGTRKKLENEAYDMFAIPFNDLYYENMEFPPSQPDGGSKLAKGDIAVKIAIEIAKELTESECYDIQLLPYCPFPELVCYSNGINLYTLTEDEDYSFIKEVDENNVEKNISIILWATSNSFKCDLGMAGNQTIYGNSNIKVENLIKKYRICSPNYQGSFDFSLAKNGNSAKFKADCTYKPYTPYIKVAPTFAYLYGTNYGDCRGLICGGDFSVSRLNDAWESYELNNKNYQNIFNREIQNLDFEQSLEMRKSQITGALGIVTGSVGGAAGGALASGSWIGAVVGGVAGTAGSAVGMGVDIDMLAKQQRETKAFAIDKFNYQLGNIKALPYTLTKIGAFNVNSKIWPFLEIYSCTEKEQTALENKLKYESMTVMRIDLFGQYWKAFDELKYFKGELIRNEELAEDNHIFEAIYAELMKGVYI